MPFTPSPSRDSASTSRRPTTSSSTSTPATGWVLNFGPQHPATHDAAAGAGARWRAIAPLHAAHRLSPPRLREARRAPRLQPVRDDRRRAWTISPRSPTTSAGTTRSRRCFRDRAHAALQGAPHHQAGSRRGSRTTSSAWARPVSTSGPSPASSSASTPARRSTTSAITSPASVHPDWTRVGGLMPETWKTSAIFKDSAGAAMEDVEKSLGEFEGLVEPQPHLHRPHQVGVGVISKEDAIGWSASPARWPVPRASSATSATTTRTSAIADNWDGQGAKRVDFRCRIATRATATHGSCAREEIKQSLHILRQLIDQHPRGSGGRLRRLQDGQAPQEGRLRLHRRADPALRAHHVQPRLEAPSPRPTARSRPPTASLGTTSSSDGSAPPLRVQDARRPASSTTRSWPRSPRGTCSATSSRSWGRSTSSPRNWTGSHASPHPGRHRRPAHRPDSSS